MSKDNYHRFPGDEKVKGVDYQFYRELLAGKYDSQINKGMSDRQLFQTDPTSYRSALVKA